MCCLGSFRGSRAARVSSASRGSCFCGAAVGRANACLVGGASLSAFGGGGSLTAGRSTGAPLSVVRDGGTAEGLAAGMVVAVEVATGASRRVVGSTGGVVGCPTGVVGGAGEGAVGVWAGLTAGSGTDSGTGSSTGVPGRGSRAAVGLGDATSTLSGRGAICTATGVAVGAGRITGGAPPLTSAPIAAEGGIISSSMAGPIIGPSVAPSGVRSHTATLVTLAALSAPA